MIGLKHRSLQSLKIGSPIEEALVFTVPIDGPVFRLAKFVNLTGEPIMFYLGIDQHAKQLTISLRRTAKSLCQHIDPAFWAPLYVVCSGSEWDFRIGQDVVN